MGWSRHRVTPRGLLLAGLLLVPWGAATADEPPSNPFGEPSGRLRIGHPIRIRGALVVPLRLRPDRQTGLDARIGLRGAKADILDLPGPAGEWHVRVANHEDRPLLVPAGETLLTPSGPSRSTDRPVWIAPNTATFVPVFQVSQEPPPGPYLSRGRGLTPFEQAIVDLNRLQQRVRFRNNRMGVPAHRRDDAAAAYGTPAFGAVWDAAPPPLRHLADGKEVVGVVVADDRGPHFAHIEFDASRFQAHWSFLLDGILLDARLLEEAGRAPVPNDVSELRSITSSLLRALQADPLSRPNFGSGWQYRWSMSEMHARWDGLAFAAGPVCATLQRNAPRPVGAPPAPGTPGGGGPGNVEDNPPGIAELERRLRPTVFEERLRDRREGLLGTTVHKSPRTGRARGKAGGSGPSSAPTPHTPRAPVPSPARPGGAGGGKSAGGGTSGGGGAGTSGRGGAKGGSSGGGASGTGGGSARGGGSTGGGGSAGGGAAGGGGFGGLR